MVELNFLQMKKRAQVPDAHTYTIVLRGLAWHPQYEQSVSRAITVYHSMYADNCPVKPNIIHTNAVLKVCALAKDLDALWGVAAKLPTRGKAAPDNLTFTTILNAIRTIAWDDSSAYNKEAHPESKQRNAKRQQAVRQGRRMWDEIVERWRTGDIVMDEELVCSMGRLLLLGYDEQDYDDVLSLLEQTMAIPRQIPRLDDPARKGYSKTGEDKRPDGGEPQLIDSRPSSDSDSQASSDLEASPLASGAVGDSEPVCTPGGEFNALVDSSNLSYARPGRNTLSLSIDACLRMRATRPAQDYWGLLTSPMGPYNIAPDSENYHMYLRLLRLQRASRLALELVKEMKSGALGGIKRDVVEAKTFRIAMSCCVRDKNNRNAAEHAQALLRMMSDTLEKADVKAMEMYLSVISNRQDWRTMMDALRLTENSITNLRSLLAYGDRYEVRRHDKEESVAFVRRLVGCYDLALALGKAEMQRDERHHAMEQRNKMTAWLTRQANKGIGPNVTAWLTRKSNQGIWRNVVGQESSEEREQARAPAEASTEDESEGKDDDAGEEETGMGTTKRTHLPRGRRSWQQYSRDQPDGRRFERDDSDDPSSTESIGPEHLGKGAAPLQDEGWRRWSKRPDRGGQMLRADFGAEKRNRGRVVGGRNW